jgi:demethylmenaquinone methyltransferase/2-methoxy-6-polyprenyl-1,4-benzoquinol methylase
MAEKQSKWLDELKRFTLTESQHLREEKAYLGYRKVSPDEKAEYVLRHFNRVARRYDLMNTLLSFGIHYLWKGTAVNMLDLNPGDRVLDVCGGTGDLSILADRVVGPAGLVIVYDINRAMIDAGRHKVTNKASRRRIKSVQGDAENLSFPDGCFDATMVGFGIRNVPRMEQGIREMYRILKPGGKMMCLEFSKPTAPLFRRLYDIHSFYIMPLLGGIIAGSRKAYLHLTESIRTFVLPDELTAIIKAAGFSQVNTRKLTNGIAMIHMATKK